MLDYTLYYNLSDKSLAATLAANKYAVGEQTPEDQQKLMNFWGALWNDLRVGSLDEFIERWRPTFFFNCSFVEDLAGRDGWFSKESARQAIAHKRHLVDRERRAIIRLAQPIVCLAQGDTNVSPGEVERFCRKMHERCVSRRAEAERSNPLRRGLAA